MQPAPPGSINEAIPSDAVWHALADATRREILDLLRLEPRTTGQLAERFPSTRFAVMKHLTTLEHAGLITIRRAGRERWNHLNAVPLQMLYQRWVRPYEAVWAQKLTALKSNLEDSNMNNPPNISIVAMEIPIKASKEKVWKALTEDITFWWPRNFYTKSDAKSFHLEPKLGGRMYEDWGGGQGLVWYNVFGLDTPNSIALQGFMGAGYGPACTILELTLAEMDGITTLKLVDSTIGKTDSCEKESGWKELFHGSFVPYVESAPAIRP
jgi:DNA-binding transcriptional ArsR family regulator